MKRSIHARIVEDSFEALESLAAKAAEEQIEDLDTNEEETEVDDVDSEDEESEEDEETEIEEEDGDEESEDEDSEEEIEIEEDEDGEGDEESEEVDSEDDETFEEVEEDDECDSSEEVDEDAVLDALAAEGLCVVISTSDMISEDDFGVAVAEMEDSEFDSESDDEDSEEESEEDEEIEEEESEDGDEDFDAEDDSESEDEESEDSEEEEIEEEEDSEEVDSEDDETFEEVEADDEDDIENVATVASLDFIARASVGDVEMVLHNHPTNPVWNVIVAGVPAARLTLASYGDKAHEVASFFVSDKFAPGVQRAMASEGVLNLLRKSNAEFYANSFKQSELFQEARSAAEQVATSKYTTAIAGLREDLVDALKIVSAGMDKNFFQKPNHLKRELFIALSNAGVHDPARVIDSVFVSANAKHFDVLAETAVEFLDKPADAREALRESIEESGVIDRSKEAPAEASIRPSTTQDAVATIRSIAAASAAAPLNSKQSIEALFR